MVDEKILIPEIPDIPQEIIDAVNDKNLLVFIGAGVSRIVGGPSWEGLAHKLIGACYAEGGDGISYFECEEVKKNSPKKIISIAKRILGPSHYREKIKEFLKADSKKLEQYPIYDYIYKLRAIYLTTNIDDVFDSKFRETHLKLTPKSLKAEDIQPLMLCHIHGSVKSLEPVILTVGEYLEHYSPEKNSWVEDLLVPLFSRNVVLFIGYGMEEVEVLENLIRQSKSIISRAFKKYILLPFYSANQNVFRHEKNFYKEFNVETIGYSIDKKGYLQLFDVMKHWQEKINNISEYQGYARKDISEVL